jgi:hypothetical protein
MSLEVFTVNLRLFYNEIISVTLFDQDFLETAMVGSSGLFHVAQRKEMTK